MPKKMNVNPAAKAQAEGDGPFDASGLDDAKTYRVTLKKSVTYGRRTLPPSQLHYMKGSVVKQFAESVSDATEAA